MILDLFPRTHARYTSLPLLGAHLDSLAGQLREEGYSCTTIRCRLSRSRALEASLQRHEVRELGDLSRKEFLLFAPSKARMDKHLSSLVRSLAVHLDAEGVLQPPVVTRVERLADTYHSHLLEVRGFAERTADGHVALARNLLAFLQFDGDPFALRTLVSPQLEAFMKAAALRQSRASLRNTAARLRSVLQYLAAQGEVPEGLDAMIDGPPVYRGEQLPRALPWERVQALLAGIDRSTAVGRRDFAMLLLAATYGLRSGEVVGLRLDDFRWRAEEIHVRRPKTGSPLILPLTAEVGAAMLDYLRNGRPSSPHRAAFLGTRPPIGPLGPSALGSVFDKWRRICGIDHPCGGAHCLRHSLAMRLLRQGVPLKAIGDLLGHFSPHSTCVYLRLNAEDLRDAALDLPTREDLP